MTCSQLLKLVETGSVVRYHTHLGDLLKAQDLSQHCYGVFWLCYALTRGQPGQELLVAAMAHDAGERRTGDMPGPVKIELGVGGRLDDMEREFLVEECGLKLPVLPPFEDHILKLADSVDGVLYCYREARLGNKAHARVFSNYLSDVLAKIVVLDNAYKTRYDSDLAFSIYETGKNTYANLSR